MRNPIVLGALLSALLAAGASAASAQTTELLLPTEATAGRARRPADVAASRRSREARVNLPALDREELGVELFPDTHLTLERTDSERPGADRLIWIGRDEYGTQAVFTVVEGVLTGTVHSDYGTFEITRDPAGEYRVVEIDPTAFASEDPDHAQDQYVDPPLVDPALDGVDPNLTAALTDPAATEIAAMIVWTPRSETAAGGRAAMDSLALNLVANANLVYANSGVPARLTLAYSGPIGFTETSNPSNDLASLRATSDGKADGVHSLRDSYGADVVTMLGEYTGTGYCGYGYIMTTLSTSFASSAFSVVDRQCSLGNLSYTHEVGHNQGMLHDRANAGTMTPSQPYAYGYQDPGGYFRTVLSYGSMTRIPYLSSPLNSYNSRVTGTSTEDNARTLLMNAATVAAFRTGPSGTTVVPSCTYSLSTKSLSFAAGGGSKSITVSAPAGCAWTASESSSWVSLSGTGGTGTASVAITTTANTTGVTRKATVTVAGVAVRVTQKY